MTSQQLTHLLSACRAHPAAGEEEVRERGQPLAGTCHRGSAFIAKLAAAQVKGGERAGTIVVKHTQNGRHSKSLGQGALIEQRPSRLRPAALICDGKECVRTGEHRYCHNLGENELLVEHFRIKLQSNPS